MTETRTSAREARKLSELFNGEASEHLGGVVSQLDEMEERALGIANTLAEMDDDDARALVDRAAVALVEANLRVSHQLRLVRRLEAEF